MSAYQKTTSIINQNTSRERRSDVCFYGGFKQGRDVRINILKDSFYSDSKYIIFSYLLNSNEGGLCGVVSTGVSRQMNTYLSTAVMGPQETIKPSSLAK